MEIELLLESMDRVRITPNHEASDGKVFEILKNNNAINGTFSLEECECQGEPYMVVSLIHTHNSTGQKLELNLAPIINLYLAAGFTLDSLSKRGSRLTGLLKK